MQLLTLRTSAGWSQEFVARQLEVSRATVDNWEKGRTEPSISMAVKIAKMFGVSINELLEVKRND